MSKDIGKIYNVGLTCQACHSRDEGYTVVIEEGHTLRSYPSCSNCQTFIVPRIELTEPAKPEEPDEVLITTKAGVIKVVDRKQQEMFEDVAALVRSGCDVKFKVEGLPAKPKEPLIPMYCPKCKHQSDINYEVESGDVWRCGRCNVKLIRGTVPKEPMIPVGMLVLAVDEDGHKVFGHIDRHRDNDDSIAAYGVGTIDGGYTRCTHKLTIPVAVVPLMFDSDGKSDYAGHFLSKDKLKTLWDKEPDHDNKD